MLNKILFSAVLLLLPLSAYGDEKMPESVKQAVLQAIDLSKGNQIFNRGYEDDKKEAIKTTTTKKIKPSKSNEKKSASRRKEERISYVFVIIHAIRLDDSMKVEFKIYDYWDDLFPKLDKNHDGKLSLEEYIGDDAKPKQLKERETHFKEKDVHNQGFLTLDDIKAFAKSKKAKDAPPDGFIAIFSATGVKTEPNRPVPMTPGLIPEDENRLCAAVKTVLAKYLNEKNHEVSIELSVSESIIDGKREVAILVGGTSHTVDEGIIYSLNENNEIVNTPVH